MTKQWNPSWGEIAEMDVQGICPSSIDSETGLPITEGETAHKWDTTTNPIGCAECGALKDPQ